MTKAQEIKARDDAAQAEYDQAINEGKGIKEAERASARVYLSWEI